MDDLLNEFLSETSQSIAVIDGALNNFEQHPDDVEILADIFRLAHTIKGTSGFLGLPRLERVADASEDVVGKFRDGKVPGAPAALSLSPPANRTEPAGDDAALIVELEAMAAGEAVATATPPTAQRLADAEAARPLAATAAPDEAKARAMKTETVIGSAAGLAADAVVGELTVAPAVPVPRVDAKTPVAARSIPVNVDVLENLMTVVSDMVLTRNQFLHMVRDDDDSAFSEPVQRLDQITADLRDGVMKTRLRPVGDAWAHLPQIVRGLADETGKKISLRMVRAETELDHQVLELVAEPLALMLRHCVRHGLESPPDRLAAGKPDVGTIVLDARQEDGQVIIEVSVDGDGLDMERIGAGVAEADPGGMDGVRAPIEAVGGSLDLTSAAGQGSSMTIKIPLRLAIVTALIVGSGGERFAVPQSSVIEMVRVSSRSKPAIEVINRTPVLRLRDQLLPLVSLEGLLELAASTATEGTAGTGSVASVPTVTGDDERFVVVCRADSTLLGIVVDRVFDTEEIVVMPVAPVLRRIPYYSGNTILGDGRVVMILDADGIATAVGAGAAGETSAGGADEAGGESTAMLIFRAGSDERKAVPLGLVARLEEIDMATCERSAGRVVVQYRGRLMPLVPFAPDHAWRDEGRQPIVVFSTGRRSVGLVVDEIVDIVDTVEDPLDIDVSGDVDGLIGSAIIGGKATDVIEAGHYLGAAFPDWFGGHGAAGATDDGWDRRVLLVDDSAFFRNLLSPMLSVAGYRVTVAASARDALGLLDEGIAFDAIVSDIDMPDMDGFAFARAVRADPRWAGLPIIALSSRASADAGGHAPGFTDSVVKSDRDSLIEALARWIAADGTGP